MGDMIDIDFGAVIDYLAEDPHTKVIVLYIEAITNARHFMSAARSAARMKPVIVLKSGRNEEGAKAAASHTGALAGMDAVYDAVFQRSGLLRAQDMDELFDAMETLARAQTLRGDRLCILTNGGGLGVLATDALISMGGKLAKLEDKTIAKLNEVLPPTWSHGNPVDIIGDAPGERYANAFRLIMNDPNVDAVLIMNCPVAIASSLEAAEAIVNAYQACNRNPKPTIITCWLGEGAPAQARQLFLEHDIPSYPTPARAVKGFKDMVDYYYNRKMSQVSNNEHANFNSKLAKSIMENALSKGQVWLTEPEAKSVLRAYGIPVLKSQEVPNVEAAYEAARDMEGKMVLKILSPDITHKSDSGGVALNLPSADAVKEAAAQMLERYKVTHPHAKMEGFSLQEMVERPGAHELILGVVDDPVFGPVMLFGTGGKAVEMIKDKALALPPLNAEIAREQIMHTRIYNLLKGYRDEPAVDIDAIVQCLVNLSELIVDFPMIKELDLNPLLVDSKGVVGLDARIKITATPTGPGDSRLVITPYPRSMEKEINIAGRGNLFLRPVKVEDEGNLCKALKKMGSSLNTQAFSNLPYEPSLLAARLTQIDYDQEIVLLVLDRQLNEILALVRIEKINEDEKILACSFGMAPEFYDHIGVLLDCVITYSKMVGINKIITEAVHSLLQEPYKKAGFELVKSAKKGMNLMVRNIA
jgi:acetyltransferase